MGDIRVGTSGYSFRSWKGNVYPAAIKSSDMFSCYINQYRLNTVEINYSYYYLPSARVFNCLISKSPSYFDFTIKLFHGITHNPFNNPPPYEIDSRLCSKFLEGIWPVVESGRLGCILAQFPAKMRRCPASWKYILSLPKVLNRLPVVCEFRNKSWAAQETVRVLGEEDIGYCAVDAPRVGVLMPLVPAVTSDIAYLRLHGRNNNWFADPSQRYDYFYTEDELSKLVPVIKSMAAKSRKMYIQFNNCHAGSALRNVKMMQFLLGIGHSPVQGELFYWN